jgi:hypothetical protein
LLYHWAPPPAQGYLFLFYPSRDISVGKIP